jgi:hypothetical protein
MTDLQQPPPAAAPSTPAEASTRLDQLKSDPAWRDGFLSGSGPQAREYRDLTALAAKGDKVDLAMAGVLGDGPWQDSGHLEMIAATKMFRELGISDATIKQTLTDYQVTQREHDAVAKWKADRMRDSEWVKKWLSGEGEHARDMMLANIALTSTIKKEA